jgi:hypothetical protein
MAITILSDAGVAEVQPKQDDQDGLWLTPAELTASTGWTIKPEGLCRGPVCVPAPPAELDRYVRDDAVNIAAFWSRMGAPTAVSDDRNIWVLGEPAETRAQQLESLEAPDFELPDVDGRVRRLSEFRGSKVFLATWASW